MAKICDNLRASILQAAMQGKLTEQLPSDGNAKELMYQILERPGRQACSYINTTDKCLIDDSCIDLPDTWEALLVGDVFSLSSGERSYSSKELLPLLNANYFRGRGASRIKNGSLVKAGNYVILVDGENSGEIFKCSEDGFLGSTFKVLDIPDVLNEDYCRYYFKLRQEELRNNKKGAAIPHLNKSIFFNLAFPIPPFAEQKRIVEKIDELFARVADLERSADALASLI